MSDARRSGVLVPLFSLRSASSWGIGEFPDIARFAQWLALAGQSFVQLLPINELPADERSPYSAMTAMALDPIFIAVPDVLEVVAMEGEAACLDQDRAALDAVRRADGIAYPDVRALKDRWLRRAWQRFAQLEVARNTTRAGQWRTFVEQESWWLDEYVLFRALHAGHGGRAWWDWPVELVQRQSEALASARRTLRDEMMYWSYVQWIAAEQWAEARRLARPVQVFGDLPFMISSNSPDVWARQDEFRFDGTVGVPPDAFSDTGQDWGLPPWRWDVMQTSGFEWIHHRARRAAALYDGFRLDHLVGLYRIYVRPRDPSVKAFFTPAEPADQLRVGETLVTLFRDSGAALVAEDLGTVPDFVRESITRLRVPGFRVMRWERRWDEDGQPFVDPATYPETSVATTGTHDTEPLVMWWEELSAADRTAVLALPAVAQHLPAQAGMTNLVPPFEPVVRDALLRAALDSGSDLVIFPLQDLFGWRDRINTPATVGDLNWTWSLHWPVDSWLDAREPSDRAATLRQWTHAARR